MQYLGSAVTDVGIIKKTNQDSLCVKIADTKEKGEVAMAVICDGMGGLSKGELASATVIRHFVDWFDKEFPERLYKYSWKDLSKEFSKMIKGLNYKIIEYGRSAGTSLGTTLSLLLIIEDKYMIAHVGDSRVYQITDKINQITEDQTYVAREIKLGRMTPQQAAVDSQRNMLLQCVGASTVVEPAFYFGNVVPNSVFVLCSDGFRHVVSDDEIFENLNFHNIPNIKNMQDNSKYLIELNKRRNERDNISVAVLKCI